MKIKPSVKLIEAVLGIKIEEMDYSPVNIIYYSFIDKENKYIKTNINIYEFAFKIKEWTETKHYNLVSSTSFKGDKKPTCMPVYENGFKHPRINADTELETIIKAGEWLMLKQQKIDKAICTYKECSKKHLCKRYKKKDKNNKSIGGIGCVYHDYSYFVEK